MFKDSSVFFYFNTYTEDTTLFLHLHFQQFHFCLFLEFSTATAKPEKYLNCRDETEANAKTKQSTCIGNKCNQWHSNISFDCGYIWTLHHDMDKSQVVMAIFINLLDKGFIRLAVFIKVVVWPLFARIYFMNILNNLPMQGPLYYHNTYYPILVIQKKNLPVGVQ